MTTISSGSGSTADYQVYTDTQLQQATQTLDAQPSDTIDSIRSLSAGYVNAYLNPPSTVELPQPATTSPLPKDTLLNGLKENSQKLNDLSSTAKDAVLSMTENQRVFYDGLNSQINNLSESDLKGLAYQPGMSSTDIKEEILFAALHPDAKVPDNVRAIANTVYTSALTSVQQMPGMEGWTPASMAWVQDTAIMVSMQALFTDAVKDFPGLSKDDIAQLHFAMENPDAVSSLPPKLQAIFHQVMGKVMSQAQVAFGIPPNWQFPSDQSTFGISSFFDTQFEHALSKLVDEGKISPQTQGMLETLHYNLNAQVPNADQLKATLQEIEKPILAKMQQQWGFPEGYRPPTNSNIRGEVLNLNYQKEFDAQLNKQVPPLTTEQKELIRQAQAYPGQNVLPPELQKIADGIKAAAISKIAKANGLPEDWSPAAGAIPDVDNLEPANPLMKAIYKHLNEILDASKNAVNTMPPGEMKNAYMVFLSVVNEALAKLSQVLTQSQVVQADMSKTMSQMRLDEELNKIKKQQHMLEEMRNQQHGKGGFLGFIMDIINWVVNIILVIVTCGAALGLIIDAMMHGQDIASLNLIDYSFQVAGRLLGKPLGGLLLMLMIIAIIVLSSLIPIVGWSISLAIIGLLACETAYGNGDILKNCLMLIGVPESDAMIASMVVGMVLSVIIDAIIFVVMLFIPGVGEIVDAALIAGEIGVWAAKISATVVRIAVEVTEAVCKIIEALGKVGRIVAEVIRAVVKAIISGLEHITEMVMDLFKAINRAQRAIDNFFEMTNKYTTALAKQAAVSLREGAADFAESAARTVLKDSIVDGIKDGVKNAADATTRTIGKGIEKVAGKGAREAVEDFVKQEWESSILKISQQDIDMEMAAAKQELKQLRASLSDLKNSFAKTDEIYRDLNTGRTITSAERDSLYGKDLDRWRNTEKITEKEQKLNQLKELKKAHLEVKRLNKESEKLSKSYEDWRQTLGDINDEFLTREGDIRDMKAQLQVYQDEIAQMQGMLQNEDKALELEKNIQKAEKALKRDRDYIHRSDLGQLDQMQTELQKARQEVNDAIKEIGKIDKDQAAMLDARFKLADAQEQYKLAKSKVKEIEELAKEVERGDASIPQDKLEKMLADAQKDLHDKTADVDRAEVAFQNADKGGILVWIMRAKSVTQEASGLLHSIQGINNNVLDAKLAELQAEYNAYATEIEYFLKLLKDMIERLMSSVTELGEDIANIGKEIRHLYQSSSQTMTSLSMAA